jgi:hypothetical protein
MISQANIALLKEDLQSLPASCNGCLAVNYGENRKPRTIEHCVEKGWIEECRACKCDTFRPVRILKGSWIEGSRGYREAMGLQDFEQ